MDGECLYVLCRHSPTPLLTGKEMNGLFEFIVHDMRVEIVIVFGCLILVSTACLLDLWCGIDAARANGERLRSHPLRKTGIKMVDYYRLQMFFLLVDILGLVFPWYNLPYATVVCTLGVLFVEGLSVVENLRRKRSHAAEVADIAADIIQCITPEEADRIIERIRDHTLNGHKKH